jgi:hypothetical protein
LRAAPYLILSDGCSSSPDTDMGARLLVKAAERLLLARAYRRSSNALSKMHSEAARVALRWAERIGLPPQAVDATLLTAHLHEDELTLGCSGDGVLLLQSRAGATDVYVIHCPSGYPLYPAYSHQPERLAALRDRGCDRKEVQHFRRAEVSAPLRLEKAWTSHLWTEVLAVNARDYKYAVLFSDGIDSFFAARRTETGRMIDAIPLDQVLRELISFKSLGGNFVGRRINRFMKDCQSKGWRHADDLAVGALHLGD